MFSKFEWIWTKVCKFNFTYEKEKVNYYILVYPDDLKAKIYKLDNNKYTKEGDFFNQTYKFENTTCKPEIDFNSVFKKYRK